MIWSVILFFIALVLVIQLTYSKERAEDGKTLLFATTRVKLLLTSMLMKIELNKSKNGKKMAVALLFVLAQYAVAFLLIADSYTNNQALMGNIVYFVFIILGATLGILLLYHYWRLRKHKDDVISYENGMLNDHSAWLGKIYNLKVEDIQSIARWSRSKRVNEYKMIVGPGYKGGNQIKKILKRRSLYIKDSVVNSNELLKLAEMIGNDIAQRNQGSAK